MIKPVSSSDTAYGSETSTLRKADENALVIFESKVLRKIYVRGESGKMEN